MRTVLKVLAIGLATAMTSGVAFAQPKAAASTTPEVPRCARSLGSVSIRNGDTAGWTYYRLQPPAALLKVVIQRSGCFTVVERGAGLDAALKERELSGDGNLQRGSNVGGGQMRAADYVLLADVIAQDKNASGGGGAGVVGGMIGGRLGAAVGGVGVRNQTAQAMLSLTNVRTTESFSTEGNATNRNITWGGGGFLGAGGAGLGGYTDTDIGRVITVAFIDAYSALVVQAGGTLSGNAAAEAPRATFVTVSPTPLRTGPNNSGSLMRTLPTGAMVYPLGERQGMYWKVADENDNEGWVNNGTLQPKR
jgi:curli biogenesis system outer membrane secretion channel CsgG